MILDLELAPADDARKDIAAVLSHVDRFLQDRENGIAHASAADVAAYLKSMVPYHTKVLAMTVFKDRYEMELELGFVKVVCKLKRY
ncbi:hypothetical protein [Chitinimonas koreensis]|uniref:hypothetical protein n=1 Tax=Chitinimonas koreensis TaxID=356302 RepID=UPI0004068F7D|nr:hypothetical protein [Chitinimonas koreensis]QNM96938.1 hypothetical protein H9L41_00890 [Chitinimonas koreensis]